MAESTGLEHTLSTTSSRLGNHFENQHYLIPRYIIQKRAEQLGLEGNSKRWVNEFIDLGRSAKEESEPGIFLRDFHYVSSIKAKTYESEIGIEVGRTLVEFTLNKNGKVEIDLSRLDAKPYSESERHLLNAQVSGLINLWEEMQIDEQQQVVETLLSQPWNASVE